MVTVFRPWQGLSHRSSRATVRTSQTCTGPTRLGDRAMTASSAAAAWARGRKNSNCRSSPALGVNSGLKWGSRWCHGPTVSSWVVVATGSMPGTGCCGVVDGSTPRSAGAGPSPSPARRLTQTASRVEGSRNDVNRLTLCAAPMTSWMPSSSAAVGTRVCTTWRTSQAGSTRSQSRVTMPRQPRASTAPGNSGSPWANRTELAVPADQLDGDDGGRQAPVRVPGPVGARGAGPGDADVRQRAEVVQGPPPGVQRGRHHGIRRASGHDRDPLLGEHLDLEGQRPRGDEGAGRVGDPRERVAGAEGPHERARGDERLQLRHRAGLLDGPGREGDVAGPVAHVSPRTRRRCR